MNDPSPRGGTEWHRRVEMPPDKKNFDFWKIIFISHSLFQAILNFNILISRISRYYNVPMFWKFWDSPKCVISICIPALQIQNSPRCGRHAWSIWLTYQYKCRRQDEEVNGGAILSLLWLWCAHHSWEKWFCLREPEFLGVFFRIYKLASSVVLTVSSAQLSRAQFA